MPLPELIEIVPPAETKPFTVVAPGSKSITNRALILAALSRGATVLRGALWSQDTQVMTDCLLALGCDIKVETDPHEKGNRTITVRTHPHRMRDGGTVDSPLELFVGNSGTTARFLAAFLSLGHGAYRLAGVPRMHERPQAPLFEALRQLGYKMVTAGDRLPAVIVGSGPIAGKCRVSIEESSQFASALILCEKAAGWHIDVVGENADESPYVAMTRAMVDVFPMEGGEYGIEPDASGGSYFWAANWLLQPSNRTPVADWPSSGMQIDASFPNFLPLPGVLSRQMDLADSIMTAMILAPFGEKPVKFTELGRLRVQECERVQAMKTELSRCGARVEEQDDTLTIWPSPLHGAVIETYDDHRIAMCFAVLGLKVAGMKIKNPSCVKKTFPNFFEKLAMTPPAGLGALILNASTGARVVELLAE